MNLSITEILAIIAIGLVLFGGKLPDVARNLGVTLKEFKEGMHDQGDSDDDDQEPERIIDQYETPEPDQQDQDKEDQS